MRKILNVAIIYNEPTVQTSKGRKYLSNLTNSLDQEINSTTKIKDIDLSEVGILEEKQDIQHALEKLGHNCSIFNAADDFINLVKFIEAKDPDVIFNMVEGLNNCSIHEMYIAGIYELLGVTYTGAGPLALGNCLNKNKTKDLLIANNIPTPKYDLCSYRSLPSKDKKLKFPLIVKPAGEDASVGIDNDSILYNYKDLSKKINYVCKKYKGKVIVEEYIDGREINVAIIGNKNPRVLPFSEISFNKMPKNLPPIVTYRAKWISGSAEYQGTNGVCPAKVTKSLAKKLEKISLKAYKLMGCRDYARIDLRIDKNNNPFILEVNPNPDISDEAGFARSSRAAGYKYDEIVQQILNFALERNKMKILLTNKQKLIRIPA
ncbi:MAG: ATP-grasp domain-containing protein [Bacteroidetes bacterium]|nr:ATP-grasp domain-containing protein [Bacteroidota bacterium]